MNQTNGKYGFPLSLGFVGGQLGCHRIDASSVKKIKIWEIMLVKSGIPVFITLSYIVLIIQKKNIFFFLILTTTSSKTIIIYFLV